MIMPKSIFQSRTFYANLIAAAVLLVGGDYVPIEYRVPIMAGLNIALRFVSSRPVSLTGS